MGHEQQQDAILNRDCIPFQHLVRDPKHARKPCNSKVLSVWDGELTGNTGLVIPVQTVSRRLCTSADVCSPRSLISPSKTVKPLLLDFYQMHSISAMSQLCTTRDSVVRCADGQTAFPRLRWLGVSQGLKSTAWFRPCHTLQTCRHCLALLRNYSNLLLPEAWKASQIVVTQLYSLLYMRCKFLEMRVQSRLQELRSEKQHLR